MELPGIQQRAGCIPDSGLLLCSFGLDGRIHGPFGDGRAGAIYDGRRVRGHVRTLHPQSVAAAALHLRLRPGHPFRHRNGRAERDRAVGQSADAAAVHHLDRTGDPFAADARRRGGAEVLPAARLFESDRCDGADGSGTGVLLALDRHRHDGDLRILLQAENQPATHGAQRHDPRHAGGCIGRHHDLSGRFQRRHRTVVGPFAGIHHAAGHLQRYAAEHGVVVGFLPAAGRRRAHVDHLAARSHHGLPPRGVASEPSRSCLDHHGRHPGTGRTGLALARHIGRMADLRTQPFRFARLRDGQHPAARGRILHLHLRGLAPRSQGSGG